MLSLNMWECEMEMMVATIVPLTIIIYVDLFTSLWTEEESGRATCKDSGSSELSLYHL